MWKIQESNGKLGLCPLFGVIMKLFSRLIPITAIMGCSPQPRPDLKIKYLAIAINIAGQGGRLGGGGLGELSDGAGGWQQNAIAHPFCRDRHFFPEDSPQNAIAPITVWVSGCQGLCIVLQRSLSIRCTPVVRQSPRKPNSIEARLG
jgi:hypothetical protein